MWIQKQIYFARFDSIDAAIAFENQCLSVGTESLPPVVQAVAFEGSTSDADFAEYYQWLIDQIGDEVGL